MPPPPEFEKLDPPPVLRLHFNELTHPSTSTFLTLVDGARVLPNAISQVIRHLYTPYKKSTIPATRSVTLILRSMGGVAYTTGLEIDEQHKEIHVSLGYITNVSKEPLRCRDEIIGVVTHEMVHCYQYNCLGTAPGGLIEGIADFVRLKAGLAPPHWGGPKKEVGEKWDSGYQKTAYFLDWLEQNHGAGTVAKINETMRLEKYDEEKFWTGLFGKDYGIDVLWKNYRESLKDDDDDDDDDDKENNDDSSSKKGIHAGKDEDKAAPEQTPGTPNPSETVIVDLDENEKQEADREATQKQRQQAKSP